MMLDYSNKVKLTEPAPNLEETKIAKIMNTKTNGTPLPYVANINSAITSSNPSLEFVPEFEHHSLADIRKELESGLPVAVWIVTSDGSNDYLHSVVVTGMDDEKKTISYNDPTYGEEKTITQSKFMDTWEEPGARMIKLKLGRIRRDTLEKYLPQEVTA